MKKLICFDLDGTLTEHRTPIEDRVLKFLDRLKNKYKLLMVGAGAAERIYKQMREYPIDILGNYGMQQTKVVDGKFIVVRKDTMQPNKEYFLEKAQYLREKYGYTKYAGDSVEFHQTGMVTFPLLGTKVDIKDKLIFDPTREKRRKMYSEVVELFQDYTVYIGGSSSFDFSAKKYNKYDAIITYAKENSFNREEILFVGDDFDDGGGDSHIRIFGLDYINIEDYRTVIDKLKFLLDE